MRGRGLQLLRDILISIIPLSKKNQWSITKNIPPYSVAVGVPVKVIKSIDKS